MATDWSNIRIPKALHDRLVRLAAAFDRSADSILPSHFQPNLPAEFADRGGTPLWYAVQRAVDELEAHRLRSTFAYRKSRKQRKEKNEAPEGGQGQAE